MQCAMHVKPEVRFNWSYLKLVKQQGQAGRAQGWLLLDWLPIKVMAMKICNGLLWYAIYIFIVFGGARWRQCSSGGCPNRFASSSELSEFLHHIVTQFPIKMQRAVSSSGHRHLEFCEVPAVPTADIENKPEAATTELQLKLNWESDQKWSWGELSLKLHAHSARLKADYRPRGMQFASIKLEACPASWLRLFRLLLLLLLL